MAMVYEASRYKVTAKYGSNRLKPREQLEKEVKEKYVTKAKASGVTVESFRVTKFEVGTGWDILNHYITVEVVLRGSPIAPAVIIAICACVALGIIVLGIWLVGKETVQTLAEAARKGAEALGKAAEAAGKLITEAPAAVTLGAGALLILALFMIGVRVPKKEKKPVAPRP